MRRDPRGPRLGGRLRGPRDPRAGDRVTDEEVYIVRVKLTGREVLELYRDFEYRGGRAYDLNDPNGMPRCAVAGPLKRWEQMARRVLDGAHRLRR
jgi:hypothetical protein